jgi:hypothetical protein
MKKLFLALIALTFSTSAVLYSCGEDSTENSNNLVEKKDISETAASRLSSDKDDFIKVRETTKLLSETLMNLGAKELVKNGNTYTFITSKGLYLFGIRENLKDYSFDYIDNTLSLSSDNTYQIYSLENNLYLETPYYKGLLENVEQKYLNEDKKLNLLIIFLGEVNSDPVRDKTTYEDYSSRYGGSCSFWDTVYNVGVGLNSAAAHANLMHNIASDIIGGDLGGCTSIGQSETSSIGGVYYSTQAWCCP